MSRTFPSGSQSLGHQSHFVPMQQAWNAAFLAFLVFINALAFGELIASGVNPNTGTRCEIDPVEWMRTGLILDVRNGDLLRWSGQAYCAVGGHHARAATCRKKKTAGTAMRLSGRLDLPENPTRGGSVENGGASPSKKQAYRQPEGSRSEDQHFSRRRV